jgi:hypothetical protein
LFFGLEGAFRLTAVRRLSPATWSEELQSYTPPRYQSLDRLHLLIPDGSARGDASEEYFLIAGDETETPDMELVGRAVGKSECRLLGVRWSPTHWKTLALMPGLAVRLSAAAREYQNRGVAAAKNGDRESAYREFERAAQIGAHMLGSWSPAMRYTGASSLVATGLKSAKYLRWGVESEERRQLAFLFKDIRANLPEASELSAIVSETQDPDMIIGLHRFLSGGGDRSVYLAWILNGVVLDFTEAEAARGALAPQRWAFLKEVAAHSDPRAAALGAAYLKVAKSVESELKSPSDSSARVREMRTLNNKMRHSVDRLKLKF